MHSRDNAHRQIPGKLAIAAIIGAFVLVDAVLAETAHAQSSVIHVPGIVRDFQRAHPDFNVVPSGGYGHYAGNIGQDLGADGRPVFTGAGYRVNAEWTNKFNQPIAPHLFLSATTIPLGSTPVLDAGATADSWDSTMGGYGSQLPGVAPSFDVGAEMPLLTAPDPFPASTGDAFYSNTRNGQPHNTLKGDMHVSNFSTQKDTILMVSGDVRIVCDGDFTIDQNTHIQVPLGSSLELWVYGLFRVSQMSSINMPPEDSFRCVIYNMGTTQMEINQDSAVCAIIYSPDAPLHLAQGDQFFGKFIGTGIQQDRFSGFHWDLAPWRDACSNTIEDIAGTAGGSSTGGVDSASTFKEWYNDVLGVNLSQIHTIEMLRNASGVYQANIAEFHPIDDRLYGNEGDVHNYFFTYTITADFVYSACNNQYFRFAGSDDAWLFIDGKLVLDIGGVLPGTDQVIEMDRLLKLEDGETYQMKLFYAQRQMTDTSFNFETNIELMPPVLTASGTAGFD